MVLTLGWSNQITPGTKDPNEPPKGGEKGNGVNSEGGREMYHPACEPIFPLIHKKPLEHKMKEIILK